jgi:hypothetical protein
MTAPVTKHHYIRSLVKNLVHFMPQQTAHNAWPQCKKAATLAKES